MQTHRNNKAAQNAWQKQSLLVIAFVLLLWVSAQITINNSSTLSFTLQTLVVGVFYYYMRTYWKLAAMLIYLIMGIAGIGVFSHGQSGWAYFSSEALGFFMGFILVAFVPIFKGNYQNHFTYFILIHLIILAVGLGVWSIYDQSMEPLLSTSIVLLPGAIIKSLAGAGITWLLSEKIRKK